MNINTCIFDLTGVPVYYMASLLEMSEHGGTDASSLMDGISSIFDKSTSKIPLSEEYFCFKLVSSTSDGASVNFGRRTGLMKRLSDSRPWLVTIHCVNHRVELAVKDALNATTFKGVDDTYVQVYYLLKNSGGFSVETLLIGWYSDLSRERNY